jgi:hypothetical protein
MPSGAADNQSAEPKKVVEGNAHQCDAYSSSRVKVLRYFDQMVWDVVDSLCIKNATLVHHEPIAIATAIMFLSQMAILRNRHYI